MHPNSRQCGSSLWASVVTFLDVVFHHPVDLQRFYPRWVNHAVTTFSSPDVMRFLGKHVNSNGQLHQDFSGEVVSDFKRRAEGVRIKHII